MVAILGAWPVGAGANRISLQRYRLLLVYLLADNKASISRP